MNKSRIILVSILFNVLLIPGLLFAQGTVQGFVVDGAAKTPVVATNVSIGVLSAITNATGFYSIISVIPGNHTMTAGAITILNVPISDGLTTTQNFWSNQPPPIVTNTLDGGLGSLRQAILDANFTTRFIDNIGFNIPGSGPHTIQPGSALPDITDPVIIDGYTQSGASPNSNPPGAGNQKRHANLQRRLRLWLSESGKRRASAGADFAIRFQQTPAHVVRFGICSAGNRR